VAVSIFLNRLLYAIIAALKHWL